MESPFDDVDEAEAPADGGEESSENDEEDTDEEGPNQGAGGAQGWKLCPVPGCGFGADDGNALRHHYMENHAVMDPDRVT